ncbi:MULTISPECIES: WG repeat-containing protein [unclassified Halomonas]|uniref:WG repeat-containing protein n=1 Tax=unclassified Halomonas TaxID=2609666 RepID=UPI0040349FD9
MKQWIVAPFLLVVVMGKVLADPSEMPQSGVYAVDSIEAVEANPIADSMLPEIEASMERAWARFNRESRTAEIYMEAQEAPLYYDFDFETNQATSLDNPTAGLRLETSEQFVMIHGVPFEVAFTFQQIDEEGPEFAALQSARDEWLESKQAALEEQGSGLAELFDVEPLSLNASDPVDGDRPYVFDMPIDWDIRGVTLSNPDLLAPEALLFSTNMGAPALLVGQLVTDVDTFRQSVISPDESQETIHLDTPERSLTIFLNQNGNLGLVGVVPNDQEAASFWVVEPNDFLVTEDIQKIIGMFYTIRMRNSLEEHISVTDPDTWPHYRLTEESEQKLKDLTSDTLSLEGLLGLMDGQVRATVFDDERRRSYPDFRLTLVDAEPEPLSLTSPLIALGSPEEGKITLWEDGNHTMCEASLSLPILSREMETVAYMRIAEYVNYYSNRGPDYSQYEYCIGAWRALQSFEKTLENKLVTDLPILARALGDSKTVYLRDGYIVVAKEVGDDMMQGLISQEGEVILPMEYKRINVRSDVIVAEDSLGKWMLSREGKKLISEPLISFESLEGREGYYTLVHSNEQGEWRKGLFDMTSQRIVLPPEFRSLSYDADKETLMVEYPDRSKALLSLTGEPISERYASILPLSGTSNYLVKDREKEEWYIANAQFEQQSETYTFARVNRAVQLVYVRFPEVGPDETRPVAIYIDYQGNRVISDEMTQEYAPSDDGYITVWVEKKPFFGILGEPRKRWGLVDRTGEVVIPLEYDQLHQAREGVVPVRRDEKFGIFSVEGSQLTDFEWGNLTPSLSGNLMARHHALKTWQLIDHQGHQQNELTFTEQPIHVFIEHHETDVLTDMFVTAHEQKFGIVSAKGEVLVPFEYESVNTDAYRPVFTDSEGEEKRYPDDFRE